jgi:hypothetical protein
LGTSENNCVFPPEIVVGVFKVTPPPPPHPLNNVKIINSEIQSNFLIILISL